MPIEFRCSQCSRLLRTPDETAGKQAKCPECGTVMEIPASPVEPAGDPFAPQASPSKSPPPEGRGGSPFSQEIPSPGGHADVENPYQSPGDYHAAPAAAAYLPAPELHAYALSRVSAPATALIVTGGLGLALQVIGLAFHIVALAVGEIPGGGLDAPFFFASSAVNVFAALLGVGLGILVVVGAIKMKKLEHYGLAMTSAIVALVPCTSPCCLLGLPFGIWALVVLSDGRVQTAFSAAKAAR